MNMNKDIPREEQREELSGTIGAVAFEEDFFSDLQTLWDEQSSRFDHILAAHPKARPVRLNLRYSRPWRRRIMAEYLMLIILNVAVGVHTIISLIPDTYYLIRITGYVLTSTNAFLTARSLYVICAILLHHPARVSVARMSHFICHSHMEPHYAPQSCKQGSRIINIDFRGAVSTAISSARQVAAVSAAVFIVLTAVSCSPIGDGYTMTKADRASRSVAVESVNAMIEQL